MKSGLVKLIFNRVPVSIFLGIILALKLIFLVYNSKKCIIQRISIVRIRKQFLYNIENLNKDMADSKRPISKTI